VSGTFSITRAVWDHAAFRDEPFTQREAWMWLISEAEWKPRERRIGRRTVSLERGQLAHSVRFMAERWQWTKSRADRFLDMLENRDMLRRESGTLGQVITICNYNEYQFAPSNIGTVAGHSAGQQRDSSGTNHNKINQVNQEEAKASSAKKRGTRLPDDWRLPQAWGTWAIEEGMDELAVRRQSERFADYWRSVPGQRGVKLDWQATWRNWIRKSLDDGRTGKSSEDDWTPFGRMPWVG